MFNDFFIHANEVWVFVKYPCILPEYGYVDTRTPIRMTKNNFEMLEIIMFSNTLLFLLLSNLTGLLRMFLYKTPIPFLVWFVKHSKDIPCISHYTYHHFK